MTRFVVRIFIAAVLLRVLIMPFLFHIDLKSLYFYASLLQDGVLNIYGYMKDNKGLLSYNQVFVYPPPVYFLQGIWLIIASPFLGSGFYGWINDWGVGNYSSDFLFRYLFILKIPNLIFDILIGILLFKIVDAEYKSRVLILWFFNPLTLYINYGLANFDIIPATWVLLSLYFYQKKKLLKSGISLGFATAFKVFPFILWPFFIVSIYKTRGREEMLKFILSVLASFALLNFPWPFELVPAYNSGLTNRAFEFKIPFLDFPLPFSNILLLVLFCMFFLKKNYQAQNINKYIFSALLILLSITSFHPQWWMWILPFLTILSAQNLIYLVFFIPVALLSGLLVIGLNDQFITLGILNPLIANINNSSFLHDYVFRSYPELIEAVSKKSLLLFALILVVLVHLKLKIKLFKFSDKYLFTLLISISLIFFASFFGLGVVSSSSKILVARYENFDRTIPVYKNHGYSDEINVSGTNIHLIAVNLKNRNARNNDPFNIKIETPEGRKREFNLTGGNIGDGVWVNLRIEPLDIKDKLKITMDSSTEATDSAISVLTSVPGKMSYQIYKRESPSSQLKQITDVFSGRIVKDLYFLAFLTGISLLLIAALAAAFFKRRL